MPADRAELEAMSVGQLLRDYSIAMRPPASPNDVRYGVDIEAELERRIQAARDEGRRGLTCQHAEHERRVRTCRKGTLFCEECERIILATPAPVGESA